MATLFKKIAPAAARMHTLFHRHARGLGFGAGGRSWRFAPASGGTPHGVTVYGTLGGTEFTVWLDEPDWRAAASSVLELAPEDMAALPDELVKAALEAFADEALAALERAVGLPVAVTRLERIASTPLSSACPFELGCDGGPSLGGAWVLAEGEDGRARIEEALAGLPAPEAEPPDDLPLIAVVSLGMWTVPAVDLEGLAPGDVVLSPGGSERFATIGSKVRCAARLTDGVLSMEGKTMTDATPAPEAAAEGAAEPMVPVDGIEVELQASVGRVTVTLAQLRQLGAGQVVEFSTPVESPATLLANGKPVATGELVDVGGRVGVRITAMAELG